MVEIENLDEIIDSVNRNLEDFDRFRNNVEYYFIHNRDLNNYPPIIHSIKSRIKQIDRIREKIKHKIQDEERTINVENVFQEITDIAGVRILHLYQKQFIIIKTAIQKQLENGEWLLIEEPVAYTWDPEAKDYFNSLGLKTELKESLYTSVHYVVKPNYETVLSCEIQIRTLFEEIWGEIDHILNYPIQNTNMSVRDQIKVLAKLVGAGSRLSDSIFRESSQ